MPRHFHNDNPSEISDGAPRDAARAEFARRLSAAMVKKGWNQSELARRASEHSPDKAIGRDVVSTYLRGKALPLPATLQALASALSVDVSDLLPTRGVPSVSQAIPKFDIRDMGEGRTWLRVNKEVSFETALKVMQIIQEEEKRE